ncbi:tetratricopeptide repeat protein [uncultured Psychroserpens sp.]|uniref:tetratricopeptide repeat protein n=1 Tax=uncultured Psychroserpens sp. TaxID=255436 RepID=UPI002607D0F0|nr:tetratricopeptide repeat protein [uncultured Psychroserpens sp.]
MKNILVLFCFLLSTTGFAQGLEQSILKDFCKCFGKINSENPSIDDSFDNCLNSVIKNYEDEIHNIFYQKFSSKDELTYGKAYDYGYEYMEKVVSNNLEFLIFECDSFYNLAEKAREKKLNDQEEKIINSKINDLTIKIEKFTFKNIFLLQRGINYFKLKNYKKARFDFKSVLEIEPENLEASLYLAFVEDYSDNFDLAISLYDNLIRKNPTEELKMLKILVERRKLESKQ